MFLSVNIFQFCLINTVEYCFKGIPKMKDTIHSILFLLALKDRYSYFRGVLIVWRRSQIREQAWWWLHYLKKWDNHFSSFFMAMFVALSKDKLITMTFKIFKYSSSYLSVLFLQLSHLRQNSPTLKLLKFHYLSLNFILLTCRSQETTSLLNEIYILKYS